MVTGQAGLRHEGISPVPEDPLHRERVRIIKISYALKKSESIMNLIIALLKNNKQCLPKTMKERNFYKYFTE